MASVLTVVQAAVLGSVVQQMSILMQGAQRWPYLRTQPSWLMTSHRMVDPVAFWPHKYISYL